MSPITTHVLDTSCGLPAQAVPITLELRGPSGAFTVIGSGFTDGDGRLRTLLPDGATVTAGVYRITFDTGAYFHAQSTRTFYPSVSVVFEVTDATQHYHVPLLLNPFGFSTYRGS
jgi:5-hydroxyisourate hydrolase